MGCASYAGARILQMTPRFDPLARKQQFPILKALSERVLVFDGGMGTQIH
ncbi:MAG: hypothetical protein ACI89X_002692, partial [Planctomycetota bacterium]